MRWGMRQRLRTARLAPAIVSLLVVAGTYGCGGNGESTRSGTSEPEPRETPSAAQWSAAKSAEKALKKHGELISGVLGPDIFDHGVACSPPDDGTDHIDCNFAFDYGMMEPPSMEVRVQPDGSLSKVLGSPDPVPGVESSERSAALLASDDYVNHAPSRTRDYACRRSPRVARDGSRTSTSATGQLCVTHLRVRDRDIQRYVEFARDGTVTRDYVLDDA